MGEIRPLPQPLSEERGEWLVMEIEGVVGGLLRSDDDINNKA